MDMRRALKNRLAAFKIPVEVRVVEAVPRNAMGKGEEMTMLRKSSDEGILSLVEARITGVDLGRLLVIMEGVRVIRRFERVGEWR